MGVLDKIRVAELFAGVGGFRVGLEGWEGKSSTSRYKKQFYSNYKVVWSNQWEPSTKAQHASMIYAKRFGEENHSNEDIANVDVKTIPDHDLLVGGFPCQDYSVATSLKNSKGLLGKKGVLWWAIHRILSEKESKPKYLFLENVDRLLISPSSQRGRDFAIILKSLSDLDYAVEWRVINAADYGMPQRRKRIFILAYHKSTQIYSEINKQSAINWLLENGILADAFPCSKSGAFERVFELGKDIVQISDNFNKAGKSGVFENSGLMVDGKVTTIKTIPYYDGKKSVLGDVLQDEDGLDASFYLKDDVDKWYYLKGAKKEMRKNAEGFEYHYSEGGMAFPDALDKPSRTIITAEGGKSASRFKHVVQAENGLRRLTPVELERLNMFPDNHTKYENVSDTKRAFLMGNALVVGVIEKIGISLMNRINGNSI